LSVNKTIDNPVDGAVLKVPYMSWQTPFAEMPAAPPKVAPVKVIAVPEPLEKDNVEFKTARVGLALFGTANLVAEHHVLLLDVPPQPIPKVS
jgi:hypothetical protein